MKMKLYIHIGMPRTGTTFLQQEIFPKIENVNFINFYFHGGILFKMATVEKFIDIFANMEDINSYIEEDKINLISDEDIYSKIWVQEDRRLARIKRIKGFFPNAKIIFGVRDRDDLLKSLYKKYVMDGGILPFDVFKQNINLAKLDYEEYVDYLFGLFGKQNVYIYRYEEMKKDIDSFVDGICNFLGTNVPPFENVRKNIGYSPSQIKISLLLNRLFRTYHNPGGLIPMPHKWLPHRVAFTVINELIK